MCVRVCIVVVCEGWLCICVETRCCFLGKKERGEGIGRVEGERLALLATILVNVPFVSFRARQFHSTALTQHYTTILQRQGAALHACGQRVDAFGCGRHHQVRRCRLQRSSSPPPAPRNHNHARLQHYHYAPTSNPGSYSHAPRSPTPMPLTNASTVSTKPASTPPKPQQHPPPRPTASSSTSPPLVPPARIEHKKSTFSKKPVPWCKRWAMPCR